MSSPQNPQSQSQSQSHSDGSTPYNPDANHTDLPGCSNYKYTDEPLLPSAIETILTSTAGAPNAPMELYIGKSLRESQPEHWLLMVRAPDAERCTLYDLSNGVPPSTYARSRLLNRRFEHWHIPVREKIANIKAAEEVEVVKAALQTKPDHCQRYVLGIVDKLEEAELVDPGTADRHKRFLQPNLFEGPKRVISEEEYLKWVEEEGRLEAGFNLLYYQGWTNYTGGGSVE